MINRRNNPKKKEERISLRKKKPALDEVARECKRLEKALRESEKRVRQLSDATFEAIAIHEDGKILEVNQAFCRMFGYDRPEAIGSLATELAAPKYRELVRKKIASADTKPYEGVAQRKDGSTFGVELVSKPFTYYGRAARVTAIRDISERKRVEGALKNLLSQLQATLDSTDDAILVVDAESRITNYSKRFLELWQMPKSIMATRDDNAAIQYVLNQLKDPEKFLAKVRELYSHPDEESFDVLEFNDGRIFERYSHPQRLDGKSIGRVWSFRDVTRRKRAEKALQESEEQFSNLAEKTPNMIFINQKGRIVYANEKCCEIMGYTSEEFLAPDFDFRRLIAPESLPTVLEKFEEHQKGREVPPYEYVLITKKGQRLHTIHTTRLITLKGEKAILGIITDITDRMHAEKALQESEELYRNLIETSPDAIAFLDLNLNLLVVNHQTEILQGARAEELIGQNALDWIAAEDYSRAVEDMEKILETGSLRNKEYNIRRKNGTFYPAEINASLVADAQKKPKAILLTVRDITVPKRAQEEMRNSEARFRSVWEGSIDGMRITDKEGTIVGVNDAYCALLGLEREELVGQSFNIAYRSTDEENQAARQQFTEKFHTRTIAPKMEATLELRSGTNLRVEMSNAFLESEGNEPLLLSIFRDITERKKAEDALRESEYWFKESQKAGRIGSYFLDFRTGYWHSSEVLDEIFGIDAEYERSIAGWTKLIHPEQRKEMIEYLDTLISKKIAFEKEYRIIRPSDGNERWVFGRGELSYGENGLPLSLIGTIQDITERKRAEEANTLLAQTLKSAQDCISVTDLNDNILFVNHAFLTTYGYGEEELIGKNIAVVRAPSVSPVQFGEILPSTLKGEWHGELINRRKDGSEFPIELWTSVVNDGEGNQIAAVGVARDITDRKRAQENLKKSEEKFRELFDNAPAGYHELDAMGTITNVNVTELRMLGYTAEEMVGRPVWEFVGGGDLSRKRVLAKLTGALSPNKNAERMYFRKDGKTIPVMVDESLLRNQRGEISGMRTVIQDITEKKRAEEVLLESNAFNAQLVRTLPFGMDIVDDKGQILFMSDAMRNLVGSDALGTRCWSTYKDDKQQCHDCPLHAGIDFEKPKMLESTGVLGGKTFQISHIGMMYQGRKAMLEVFEDVSERKKAEGALRQSEEKYRSLFEESKDVVYISTPDGKLLDINPAGVELLGYKTKEEMLQINIAHGLFADPQQREKMRRLMEDQGFIKNFEEVLRGKDGRKIIVLDTATSVRDVDGRTILFRGMMRDVTKEKQLEEELTQIQKLESIGTLASGIAHDFNNILGIVLGYSSLIERVAHNPEKLSQSVQSINAAVQRGASLVKQILTFARKADVVFGPIDVNVMVREIVRMLRETFPRTIEISLQLDRELPFITADGTQMHQVLLNISVNARDAMPIGGILSFKTGVAKGSSLRNAFSDVQDGDYAQIIITDTGVGMDDETRAHIFDPFFTTKEKEKGTGLGLSVVYGVMKKHNGFIEVQSEPGKGTTFNLYFPISNEGLRAAGGQDENREEVHGGTETILVVEDEVALLRMSKAILEVNGYRVLTAVDGLEALALYRKHKDEIALVVTDIGLPKISGDQLFYELKKVNPSVRAVLVSGFIDPALKSEILKAGVHDFVEKPCDPFDVLKKVRESLDRE